MTHELRLHSSEVLGFAAGLYHEIGGIELGSASPTRILNSRTGRRWSAQQWYDLLEPHYLQIISPTPPPKSVHCQELSTTDASTRLSAAQDYPTPGVLQ